jgi:hypothetical protein
MRKVIKIILMAAAFIAAGLAASQLNSRWPSNASATQPILPKNTQNVVLIFHGTGGGEEPTLQAIGKRLSDLTANEPNTRVIHYGWAPWSEDRYRAAIHGETIGAELGAELAKLTRLTTIQLIGHSAGAYIMDPLCEAYRERTGANAFVDMVFLDPMGIHGMFDFEYGYRNYGRCADRATAWINTDDPVPGTNQPLDQAHNIDVTNAPERENYTKEGHLWPVQAYLDFLAH